MDVQDYRRRYYAKHRDKYRAHRRRQLAEIEAIILSAKSRPCEDCGHEFPHYVMEFDHVRGEKLFNVGGAHGAGIMKLIAEIEKCDVVCANCHRTRTWERGSLRKGGSRYRD